MLQTLGSQAAGRVAQQVLPKPAKGMQHNLEGLDARVLLFLFYRPLPDLLAN